MEDFDCGYDDELSDMEQFEVEQLWKEECLERAENAQNVWEFQNSEYFKS